MSESRHLEEVQRFPLTWPLGWPRTPSYKRRNAAFSTKRTVDKNLTIAIAAQRLDNEITRLGAIEPVLSTNLRIRVTGFMETQGAQPTDPGAAVYFKFKGRAIVLACDTYRTVADNIAAVAAHIEALRRIERYGVGRIEQALAGYRALPADSAADWRNVFGFPAGSRPTKAEVKDRYLERAKVSHPDRGGSDVEFSHIGRALEFANEELQ